MNLSAMIDHVLRLRRQGVTTIYIDIDENRYLVNGKTEKELEAEVSTLIKPKDNIGVYAPELSIL